MFKWIGLFISLGLTIIMVDLATDRWLDYLDHLALIVLFGVVFGGLMFTYSNKTFYFLSFTWRKQLSSQEVFEALGFYNYLTKLIFNACLLVLLVSLIIIGIHWHDILSIKQSVGSAVLSCLYGTMLAYFVVQPIKHQILFKTMNKVQSGVNHE